MTTLACSFLKTISEFPIIKLRRSRCVVASVRKEPTRHVGVCERPLESGRFHLLCSGTLGATSLYEGNILSFVKVFVSHSFDTRRMEEEILPTRQFDESKSLVRQCLDRTLRHSQSVRVETPVRFHLRRKAGRAISPEGRIIPDRPSVHNDPRIWPVLPCAIDWELGSNQNRAD
jgi:hypothetical protein